jgi:PTH1 family peptidyl-tRNA hydrolase
VAEGTWNGLPVRVLEPQTYMNRSGAAVAPLLALPGFDPSRDLLILVDEVALPLGRFRLRGAGSAGGHNGLKSVEGVLRRQDYARLRIGVGPVPPGLEGLTDYVLDPFPPEEREILDELLDPMADAVETWLDQGIEMAMNRHNRS